MVWWVETAPTQALHIMKDVGVPTLARRYCIAQSFSNFFVLQSHFEKDFSM